MSTAFVANVALSLLQLSLRPRSNRDDVWPELENEIKWKIIDKLSLADEQTIRERELKLRHWATKYAPLHSSDGLQLYTWARARILHAVAPAEVRPQPLVSTLVFVQETLELIRTRRVP